MNKKGTNKNGSKRKKHMDTDDIYFISESYDYDNYDVYIYKVSLDGEHFELIKSLEYNDTYSILYYTHDNIFYIQVRDNYSTLSLNAYDITNNSYYNIGYNFTYSSYSSTFNDGLIFFNICIGCPQDCRNCICKESRNQ